MADDTLTYNLTELKAQSDHLAQQLDVFARTVAQYQTHYHDLRDKLAALARHHGVDLDTLGASATSPPAAVLGPSAPSSSAAARSPAPPSTASSSRGSASGEASSHTGRGSRGSGGSEA